MFTFETLHFLASNLLVKANFRKFREGFWIFYRLEVFSRFMHWRTSVPVYSSPNYLRWHLLFTQIIDTSSDLYTVQCVHLSESLLGHWTRGYAHTHTHTQGYCVYMFITYSMTTCRPASVLILICGSRGICRQILATDRQYPKRLPIDVP